MSTVTYTSSERPQEKPGVDIPPCCGQSPVVWMWKRKGLAAIACVSSDCPNHEGVLGYSEQDARDSWLEFRREALP